MQRPIKPEWLIRQANELAGRGAQSGQPRNANLRRAVSAAYYALFHEVTFTAATQVLPNGTAIQRWELCRCFTHRGLRSAAKSLTSTSNPSKQAASLIRAARESRDLVDVALAIETLAEARNRADYDHLASFSRPEALNHIDIAEDAVNKLARLVGSAEGEAFLALCFWRSNGQRA